MIATPDDVVHALVKGESRVQWEPHMSSFEEASDELKLVFLSVREEKTHSEPLSFAFHKSQDGHFYVLERANGRALRFYSMQAVRNKPYLMRVVQYSLVDAAVMHHRGRSAVEGSLNALRAYCMNQDSLVEMQLQFRT